MKTSALVALVAVCAPALPAAAAHVLVTYPIYNDSTVPPTFVGCGVLGWGNPDRAPHAAMGIQPCGPFPHGFLP